MLLLSETSTSESEMTVGTEAERRRGIRVRQDRPIKVYEPTSHRYFGGQTQDISSTGLRVELSPSTPAIEGRLVSVHVGLSSRGEALANRRQMMPARIVWLRRIVQHGHPRLIAGLELVASVAAHLDAA